MVQVYFFYSILVLLFIPVYAHAEDFFDQTESDFKQVQADQHTLISFQENADSQEPDAQPEELLDYPGYNPAEDDCLLQNLLIQQLYPCETLPEEEDEQEECSSNSEPELEVHAELAPNSPFLRSVFPKGTSK